VFFSFNATSTTELYTLSLHDALPIWRHATRVQRILVLFAAISAYVSGQTLKKIAAINLPGPKGQRFDYLTMDDEDGYLLSAHLEIGRAHVINVRTNTLVKAIPGVPGITGLEYLPVLRKVFTSNWGEEKIGRSEERRVGKE